MNKDIDSGASSEKVTTENENESIEIDLDSPTTIVALSGMLIMCTGLLIGTAGVLDAINELNVNNAEAVIIGALLLGLGKFITEKVDHQDNLNIEP